MRSTSAVMSTHELGINIKMVFLNLILDGSRGESILFKEKLITLASVSLPLVMARIGTRLKSYQHLSIKVTRFMCTTEWEGFLE